MVFSSTIFLFLFLPALLAIHFVLPKCFRNTALLAGSLLFYAWGEPAFVLVMVASIVVNYLFGIWVDRWQGRAAARLPVALAVVANLGLLAVFKYANFLAENWNTLAPRLGLGRLDFEPIPLPIGISFFTFQAMSYVIDIYRKEAAVQPNPFRVALYISLFPQLIAGPIVRYRDVAAQLVHRTIDVEGFALGVRRFTVGLAKKVIVANTVAWPADQIFALDPSQLTASLAWLATICYTIQIYFDFSGYSDMAIGLGHMFGFRFLENFNYPYVARDIREFWRRWHISLSTWFRDYLYIPLGGNRQSATRTHVNLVTVFFLCGLWHGAAWTFVIWGLYHGAFLVMERTPLGRLVQRAPDPVRRLYTLLTVMVGWVIFRSETFADAVAMLTAMVGAGTAAHPRPLGLYLTRDVVLAILLGIAGSVPLVPALGRRLGRWAEQGQPLRAGLWGGLTVALPILLLVLSAVLLSGQAHNPFIYFRF